MNACPFGRSGALSHRRHLHHLARVEDRGRGDLPARSARATNPGAANAFPTGATAKRWRACALRSRRCGGEIAARHRPQRAARRDEGGRGAQRGRLRAVGPGGQDHRPTAWPTRSARSPPRAARDGFHAVARRRRRRWPRRRAPMPSRPLLKVKIGGEGDIARIRAVVRGGARTAGIILDANEGWTDDNIRENLAVAAELGVALIEQPLPAGKDGDPAPASRIRCRSAPTRACMTADDLDALVGLYDAVNIKLDKAGGLTAALAAARPRARTRLLRSWSAAWSAHRSPWRRRCCWRRMPISSISTGRCCWRATARRRLSIRVRWCHRPSRRSGAERAASCNQHQARPARSPPWRRSRRRRSRS